jgi:4-carboxymuconolactone decarboxylase
MSEKFEKGLPFLKLHLGEEGAKRAMENSPELTQFVVEHGFADMYTNEALDQKSRKIATLASLITSASLPQFEWHTRGALESRLLTADEVKQIVIQMTIYIGFPAAYNAMGIAKKVIAEFEPA